VPRHDERVLDPDLLLDVAARERLIARFGTEVKLWCAALPELVELCCLRWHLELDHGLSGSTSRVFIGRQHSSRAVVLKLTPDLSIANEEALALRAWTVTPHAVDLLDADLETGALLLEKIEPGTKLSDRGEPGAWGQDAARGHRGDLRSDLLKWRHRRFEVN